MRAEKCQPVCWRQSFGAFPHRMLQLWGYVGRQEIVNSDTGRSNHSIDWGAFDAALKVGHELTLFDDAADIFEAMILIRSTKMRDQAEWLDDAPAMSAVDEDVNERESANE